MQLPCVLAKFQAFPASDPLTGSERPALGGEMLSGLQFLAFAHALDRFKTLRDRTSPGLAARSSGGTFPHVVRSLAS